jgi:hypothetical protein
MPDTIMLSTVLSELDEKLGADGKPKVFSVKFDSKNGQRIYLHRAISVGLGNINLKEKAMRGMLPVDKNYDKTGHHYPVSIWHIVEFNGKKVVLK